MAGTFWQAYRNRHNPDKIWWFRVISVPHLGTMMEPAGKIYYSRLLTKFNQDWQPLFIPVQPATKCAEDEQYMRNMGRHRIISARTIH